MFDIVSCDSPNDIYISPVGCFGIIRRKEERNFSINSRLEKVLLSISAEMSAMEIEKKSRVQQRGRFSLSVEETKKTCFDIPSANKPPSIKKTVQSKISDIHSEKHF